MFCNQLTSNIVNTTTCAVSQNISCTDVILNGVDLSALLAAASTLAPSVGQVLRAQRTLMSPHSNISVPTIGSIVVCSSITYTPVCSQSFVHVTFIATRLASGGSGSWAQFMSSLTVGSTEIGSTTHGTNDTQQLVDSSPTYGSYTNSSLTSLTFNANIRQMSGTQSMLFSSRVEQRRAGLTFRKPSAKEKENDAKAYAHRTLWWRFSNNVERIGKAAVQVGGALSTMYQVGKGIGTVARYAAPLLGFL